MNVLVTVGAGYIGRHTTIAIQVAESLVSAPKKKVAIIDALKHFVFIS